MCHFKYTSFYRFLITFACLRVQTSSYLFYPNMIAWKNKAVSKVTKILFPTQRAEISNVWNVEQISLTCIKERCAHLGLTALPWEYFRGSFLLNLVDFMISTHRSNLILLPWLSIIALLLSDRILARFRPQWSHVLGTIHRYSSFSISLILKAEHWWKEGVKGQLFDFWDTILMRRSLL